MPGKIKMGMGKGKGGGPYKVDPREKGGFNQEPKPGSRRKKTEAPSEMGQRFTNPKASQKPKPGKTRPGFGIMPVKPKKNK
jgi:hypothetical protein